MEETTLKKMAIGFSETSIPMYETSWCHIVTSLKTVITSPAGRNSNLIPLKAGFCMKLFISVGQARPSQAKPSQRAN
jgi:hypothetical protein